MLWVLMACMRSLLWAYYHLQNSWPHIDQPLTCNVKRDPFRDSCTSLLLLRENKKRKYQVFHRIKVANVLDLDTSDPH